MVNFETAVAVGGIGLIYVVVDASIRLGAEHFILKFGLFLTGLWLAVLESGVVAELARFNNATTNLQNMLDRFYIILLWTAIAATLYFILWLLKKQWQIISALIIRVFSGRKKG